MSKYKAGDKIVLEITGINELGSYNFGDITYSWLVSSGFFDKFSEPLSEYTDPLNDKIKRQAAEITRLLRENEELKGLNKAVCDTCKHDEFIKETREHARAAGQEEAWALFKKLSDMEFFELVDIFDDNCPWSAAAKYTYTEAAAKVEAYERQKEICVGDEVELINGVKFFVTHYCDGYANGIESSGRCFYVFLGQDGKKTGRHLDIAAMLKRIGGEE